MGKRVFSLQMTVFCTWGMWQMLAALCALLLCILVVSSLRA